jgi:hypothetical protein
MTRDELKTEILKVLDQLPDEYLQGILDFINQSQRQLENQAKRHKNFEKILAEDENLFKKLAK